MGFTIFTKSGVFNPGNYGLSPGDSIQIVCVGAGAGGTGFSYNTNNMSFSYFSGEAGGVSSFGNIVSASGGLPGAQKSIQNNRILTTTEGSNTVTYGTGEPGQGGWLPGVGSLYSFSPPAIITEGNMISCSPSYDKGITSWGGRCVVNSTGQDGNYFGIGSKGAYGNGTYNSSNTIYRAVGCGGSGGYGAGGPGACCSNQQIALSGVTAGKAGTLAIKDYLITSLDDIAITVGVGGAGGSGAYYGGAGAPGCVAIFW